MNSPEFHKKWNALYLKSRHERKVGLLLEQNGIDYYLPLVKTLKLWSDRKKWVEEPLFRGYIFVPANEKIQEKLLFVPGVVGFVRYNGTHAIVKQEELLVLQSFIEKGYHIEAESGNLSKGDKIKINAGPLKGLEGAVLELKGETFFLIAVESIGQTLKVKVNKEVLTKLN
ncbi:MAG: UpxY family transcription antiterminator [Bacteroidetes bacterium]|nr:UpxY family transcription antiterminator [Bacteroidota bacterium]